MTTPHIYTLKRRLMYYLGVTATIYFSATALTHAACAEMQGGEALGAWRVVNVCSDTIIGNFCYDDDSPMSCGSGGGGFGPIRGGGSEMVSPPDGNRQVTWHTKSCNYEAWNKGECTFN